MTTHHSIPQSSLVAGLALRCDADNPSAFPGYPAHEKLELVVSAGLSPARAFDAVVTEGRNAPVSAVAASEPRRVFWLSSAEKPNESSRSGAR